MHIGLIGGIGPAATEFYYRGLIRRHEDSKTSLDLTIAHADVIEMVRNLSNRDASKQASVFAHLIDRLARAGADAAAITSIGGHFCIDDLVKVSPIPLINALPVVRQAFEEKGLHSVGLIGTRMVMATRLYGSVPSTSMLVPEGEEFEQVQAAYGAMAVAGRASDSQRQLFFNAGKRLIARGAEAIVLGGTDLFLAFAGQDVGYPVIDLADAHVDAIYQASL